MLPEPFQGTSDIAAKEIRCCSRTVQISYGLSGVAPSIFSSPPWLLILVCRVRTLMAPPFELRKMLGTSGGFPAIANRRHYWLCQNIPSRLSKTTCAVLGKRKLGRPACLLPQGGAENGTRTRRGPFHPCEPPLMRLPLAVVYKITTSKLAQATVLSTHHATS